MSRVLSSRCQVIVAIVITVAAGTAYAQPADLTGRWDVVVTTKFSQGKSLLVLQHKGQTLSGYIDGQYGKADLTGTVTGTAFTFSFTLILEDGKASKVLYEGTADKNVLTGKVTIPSVVAGTFKAARQ